MRLLSALTALVAASSDRAWAGADGAIRPNVVIVFVDNLGNGDLGCFGSTLHRTPHVDRLAREGTRFTSFYVASGVCTPSRASLLTGCYPRRLNLHVSDTNGAVPQPVSSRGLNPDEVTIAEVLGRAGYATACFGKWHLGDQPAFLPTRQGFNDFFGIPYSEDMTRDQRPDRWPELPLLRDGRVVEAPVDRRTLVKRCTEEAVAFIMRPRGDCRKTAGDCPDFAQSSEQNGTVPLPGSRFATVPPRDRPFFLYLPLPSPGSTAEPFASESFRGKSRNGAYGDAVEELDWTTGEIMSALARAGLARNTLVVWTSDNGAVRRNPPQGSSAPYRGFGYDTSEGAMRMPCIMRWPGQVPAGKVCDELLSTLDLLPTLAALAGTPLPHRRIDGHPVGPILFGEPGARSPWDEEGFLFYFMDQLQAVRSGPWKLYLALDAKYVNLARKTAPSRLALFDVRNDPGETREVAAEHPEVVMRLIALAAQGRRELGDMDRPGAAQRSAGQVENPRPLIP